jgi:uncharacterized protein YgiM (DUF1202 family)
MKLNCWILFGVMLSTSLLAQQVADAPPSAPLGTAAPAASTNAAAVASVTNAAAPKTTSKKKTATKKKAPKKTDAATELKTVPLVPGPAIVAATHVNVRGQAKINSEVVTRLTNGQPVMVIEEITRNDSGPDEPSAWAKIALPPGGHTWVNTTYLDANKAVKPKKLNLRAGPGENYSILGQMQSGETVNPVNTKGDWTEIEPPPNAFAFVAAQYLKQEAPGAMASTTSEPATTATVAEAPVIAAATTDTSSTNPPSETTATTNTPAEATPAETTETAAATEEPPPTRIVQREGLVRGTFSIQAPTHFELISPDNGKTIDYLYTSAPSLDLRRYKGLRIIVTGEEGLEERWGNTPMLTIQKIQVVE